MPISAQTSGRLSKAIKSLHKLSREFDSLSDKDFERKLKALRKRTIGVFNTCPLCHKRTLHTFQHGAHKNICASCYATLDVSDYYGE